MRVIHTSDWHLGRILNQFHLTDDQAHVLEQLVALAKDEKADAFVVSGDIYDRAVPPPEAVALLDDFVSRVALNLKIPVIAIAGNHDSRERLGFGARILQRGKLHLFGAPVPAVPFVELADAHGPVRFYCLPYAEPTEWREALGDEAVRDHEAGFQRYLRDVQASHPKGTRSVLVAHCFASGGMVSDSERPLVIGGGGQVDAGLFAAFDYAALGHLHRSQRAGKAQYSGSILKYSASEAAHAKSVCVVELNETGSCKVETRAITPRRDLRVVEGLFEAISRGLRSEDYVHVVLKDKLPVIDAAGRLRDVFPNLLGVERPEETPRADRPQAAVIAGMSDEALFRAFFKQVSGEEPDKTSIEVFKDAVSAVNRMEEDPS